MQLINNWLNVEVYHGAPHGLRKVFVAIYDNVDYPASLLNVLWTHIVGVMMQESTCLIHLVERLLEVCDTPQDLWGISETNSVTLRMGRPVVAQANLEALGSPAWVLDIFLLDEGFYGRCQTSTVSIGRSPRMADAKEKL